MSRTSSSTLFLILIVFIADFAFAADKRVIHTARLDSSLTATKKEIRVRPDSSTSVLPQNHPADSTRWLVNGWVTGGELYKNYIDPSLSCDDAYPFFIHQVNMPMYFAQPTSIFVSVDIEDVYYSSAECPWPDTVLAISLDYQILIPEAGLYDLWIPLDEPLAVTGPFFAGFFIGNTMDTAVGACVVTNSDTTASCMSYNIWDERFGFVDLLNNGVCEFPGQLCLYVSGRAGGKDVRAEPEPELKILAPTDGQQVFGETTVWAYECSGSRIIDYVTFEYASPDGWVEIGHSFNGSRAMREGLSAAPETGSYSQRWSFAALDEGYCTLRVTAHDTLGRSGSDEIRVYLEPTPPTPAIVSPKGCSNFCSGIELRASCPDDDLTRMRAYHKAGDNEYSAGIHPLNQSDYGEYGSYYSGPVAAAMALQMWAERGCSSLTETPGGNYSVAWLVEDLAHHFNTRKNGGTCDGELFDGLLKHNTEHGSPLVFTARHLPRYSAIRTRLEEEEKAVLLALSGSPAQWIAVDGFLGWVSDEDSYFMAVCDPGSGTKKICPIRDTFGGAELKLYGQWQPIELMITIGARDWKVARTLIGEDSDDTDGWSVAWTPDDLPAPSCHFIRVEAIDRMGMTDYHTIILNHDCSQFHVAGDYDGDGLANIVDLAYLADFVADRGPEPVGGQIRADANGDNRINVTDVVYYVNYLYGAAGPPCH